jgi:hypothetical protein
MTQIVMVREFSVIQPVYRMVACCYGSGEAVTDPRPSRHRAGHL